MHISKRMADKNKLPQKWINTPFAFTRLSRNLSLLQQAVLIKVSEQLQPFIKEFFGSDLSKSKRVPKPLFSEAVKNAGVTQIYISYAELGVPENNYFAVKQAMSEVLSVKLEGPVKKPDGSWGLKMYNVFKSGDTSIRNTGVVFCLNSEIIDPERHLYVLDCAFNMVEKYVSHPNDIALIGEVARMPMIYYILRDESGNNWKNIPIELSVTKLKTYLGMLIIKDGEIVEEKYPKFSQFKKNVLDTSIADINRLKKIGQLDVGILYEPVYNGKRKVGNPAFIRFFVYEKTEDLLREEAKIKWQSLLKVYKGVLLEHLMTFNVLSFDGKFLLLSGTEERITAFENGLNDDELEYLKKCLKNKKVFGKVISWRYKLLKK